MSKVEITRWPVLLYANYRTGSNLLGKQLARDNDAAWHNEPIRDTFRLLEFLKSYYSADNTYIVKCMPDQVGHIKETADLLTSECFKIRLLRRDELAQIVSYYIALMRDQWVQTSKDISDYAVPLDYQKLEVAIDTIMKNNQDLLNSKTYFDYTLYYEDLNFDDNVLYKITPPTNIDILKSVIGRVYEQR